MLRQEQWSGLPMPFCRGSSQPGSNPCLPPRAGRFYHWATWEAKVSDWISSLDFIFNLCLLPTKNCRWTSASVRMTSLITAVPDLQRSLKELKEEIRNEHSVPCKNLRMDLHRIRYFLILWTPLASSHIYKSTKNHSWGHLSLMTRSDLLVTRRKPLPKCVFDYPYPPSPKSHYTGLPFRAVPQSSLRGSVSWAESPYFAQIKFNSQLPRCGFLSWHYPSLQGEVMSPPASSSPIMFLLTSLRSEKKKKKNQFSQLAIQTKEDNVNRRTLWTNWLYCDILEKKRGGCWDTAMQPCLAGL